MGTENLLIQFMDLTVLQEYLENWVHLSGRGDEWDGRPLHPHRVPWNRRLCSHLDCETHQPRLNPMYRGAGEHSGAVDHVYLPESK